MANNTDNNVDYTDKLQDPEYLEFKAWAEKLDDTEEVTYQFFLDYTRTGYYYMDKKVMDRQTYVDLLKKYPYIEKLNLSERPAEILQAQKRSGLLEKYPSLKKLEDNPDYEEVGGGREERVLEFVQNHPTFPEIRGNPSKILALVDEFSSREDFLISVGPDKERIITEIITAEKPLVLVELGGYLGYSAILFAAAMRRAHPAPATPRVWSLEFNPEYAAIAAKFVELAGLSDIVEFVVGPAEQSIRRLKAEGVWETGVDVVFLDHVEALYEIDLKVFEDLDLLKEGSLILADNVIRPGAPEYLKYVRAHPRFESHGVEALIMPGEFKDEIEVTRVKK